MADVPSTTGRPAADDLRSHSPTSAAIDVTSLASTLSSDTRLARRRCVEPGDDHRRRVVDEEVVAQGVQRDVDAQRLSA